jgi:hypothetical protein
MSRVYRVLIAVSWGLGLLSLVAGIVLRVSPALTQRTNVNARGGLIFAGVLFLCALATREMERTSSPAS